MNVVKHLRIYLGLTSTEMKMFYTAMLILFISSGILGETEKKGCKRLACVVRNDAPKGFIPNQVNKDMCTHLIYDYAQIEENILKNVYRNELSVKGKMGLYARFNALKRKNSKLITLLRAATLWEQKNKPLSEMASTEERRKMFITTTIDYLRKENFDGVDIVWSYPSRFTENTNDIHRAADLIKETFEAFENESMVTGKPRLLLSMTVHPWRPSYYDTGVLKRYTDMINVICARMEGSWNPHMYHHSSIHEFKAVVETYWGTTGIPLEKLNIGMAFFGVYAHVENKTNPDPGGRVVDVRKNALYTPASCGALKYPAICKLTYDKNKVYRDEARRVPYYFNDGLWLGYDDPLSLSEKAQYAAEQGTGVYVEYLNDDDYNGTSCESGKNPLLRGVFRGCNA